MTITAGYGTTLQYSDDDFSSDDNTITQLLTVDPPSPTVDVIESKPLDAASQTVLKYAGWRDSGDFTFTAEHQNAQFDALYAVLGDTIDFKITYAADSAAGGGAVVTFSAIITGVKTTVDGEGLNIDEVTAAISGPVTVA